MLKFHLLGRVRITLDGQPISGFASEKELLLLCYLLTNPGEHSRPQLAGLLWGGMTEERARANLSTAIYNLRQLLPDYIDAGRKTAVFRHDQPVWFDTAVLQQALNEGDDALAAAVAHYRGPFLDGVFPQDAPELEAWLQQERERWRLLALTGLDRLAQRQIRAGEWSAAIASLRRLLTIEPWREESHRALMRLLARGGRLNAALAQYHICRELLQTELGMEPMAETTAVYQRIQAARLRPQLHNLPPQPTPLVGRAAEMGQLFALFNDPARRLITLAGPGGSGKTRLAVTAAGSQGYAFLDGVYFIPMAEATSDAALVRAIAAALSLTPTAGEEKAQLINYLRGKEILLLLDNVEQALEPTADLVVALLETAPRLRLLVTSREYLQLRWETRLSLNGLPVPPDDTAAGITDFDAVQLFVQMAQRVQPSFRLNGHRPAVAALCRLVEGLPLAIELTAALLDHQTPEQLLIQVEQSLDRLAATMRDMPDRHRSLRAVFDYSWALLSVVQKEALARLALFRGSFTAQAATAVARATPALLAALTAKSLARAAGDGRFALHEVIRQYALEQLEISGMAVAASAAHAAYFATQIEQATAALYGPTQTAIAHQLLTDLANIEVAWQTAVDAGNVDLLLTMAPGLTRFYQVAGLYQAGVTTFGAARIGLTSAPPALYIYQAIFLQEQHEYTAALTAVDAAVAAGLSDPALSAQARLITTAAYLRQGDLDAAQETAARALAEAEALQIPRLQAQAWRLSGELGERSGNYTQAEEAIRRALTIYEESGDPLELAQTYQTLGIVQFRRDDMIAAKELLEKALVVQRQVDPSGLGSARVLVNLGTVIGNLGQKEESRRYYQEALTIFQQVGDRSGAALAADMLGQIAAGDYSFVEARAYYEQALALHQDIGQRRGVADASRHLADLALRLGAYGEAQQTFTAVLETYRAIQERRSMGTTLARLALAHYYQGDYETAEQQAEAALVVAEEIGNSLLRGYGLSSLGHALRGQEKWERATAVYTEAIAVWREWDAVGLKAETQVALAAVHHAARRVDVGLPLLEAAVACLEDDPQPDCDALGQLYLDCIMLLQTKGYDERAGYLLTQAIETLNRQAAEIVGEQNRTTFLTGIAAHERLFAMARATGLPPASPARE